MPYTAKMKKIKDFVYKIENPSELRLVMHVRPIHIRALLLGYPALIHPCIREAAGRPPTSAAVFLDGYSTFHNKHPPVKKNTGAMASMIFDGTFRLMLSLSTLSDMMHAQILKKKVTLKLSVSMVYSGFLALVYAFLQGDVVFDKRTTYNFRNPHVHS